MTNESTFVRGNDRLRTTLERPGVAQAVAEIEDEAAELDRTHAMSLAMIREAGKLTHPGHRVGLPADFHQQPGLT